MITRTAMAKCREILKRSGSSFALAFRVLPAGQRNAMTAFYAFCRNVDDMVDEAPDRETARCAVEKWKKKIDDVFGGRPRDPVCQALQWAVERFGIERKDLELILEGVEQDLHIRYYEDFAGLYEYCYRVASAVGLVCLSILGERSRNADLYAEMTGIAVQLTNILRDVGEDAGMGRIYIPKEDLRTFGVSEEDVLSGRMTRGMKSLMRFESNRARQYYLLAEGALGRDARRRLFFPEALRETYLRLLDRLVDQEFPVFKRRVSVGKREKISIALKHRLHPSTFLGANR